MQERNNHFEQLGAKEQLNLEVEFETSDISLDIPLEDGVVVNEWSLLPLTSSKVRLANCYRIYLNSSRTLINSRP